MGSKLCGSAHRVVVEGGLGRAVGNLAGEPVGAAGAQRDDASPVVAASEVSLSELGDQ